ncbi:MAG: hypothetical protein F9K27_16490 [Anaerolineae bacterium]|nr:MAG: hypothetical protein F9K27_16490 [Anaerolineae bacterium]
MQADLIEVESTNWKELMERVLTGDMGVTDMRQNIEPDFLVCHAGKWGVLQIVDSLKPSFDPKQERLLKFHGVKVIESFAADFCLEYPDNVVNDFLNILENS